MFKIVKVQHYVGIAAKVAFQPVQRDSHNIAVMHFPAARNITHLNPELMNQIDVLFSEMRRVRSQINNVLRSIRIYYFELHLPARKFDQAFPCAAKLASLLLPKAHTRRPMWPIARRNGPEP